MGPNRSSGRSSARREPPAAAARLSFKSHVCHRSLEWNGSLTWRGCHAAESMLYKRRSRVSAKADRTVVSVSGLGFRKSSSALLRQFQACIRFPTLHIVTSPLCVDFLRASRVIYLQQYPQRDLKVCHTTWSFAVDAGRSFRVFAHKSYWHHDQSSRHTVLEGLCQRSQQPKPG